MTLILRRLEQWSFGPDGPRWRRPHRAAYTRLHSSLISKGRETMSGRGLIRDPPEERLQPPPPPAQPIANVAPSAVKSTGLVTRDDQRSYVKIEVLLGKKNASDIHDSLRQACGNDAVQRSTVYYWASVFREDGAPEDHQPAHGRQGPPSAATTTTYSLRM